MLLTRSGGLLAQRRPLLGHPLLVAVGGIVLNVGCSEPEVLQPPGNLMPPPTMTGELCVDTSPETALVTINGTLVEPRCAPVSGEPGTTVAVHVSAPGYQSEDQSVPLAPKMDIHVVLKAEIPEAVGNQIAPPTPVITRPSPVIARPSPVGNLMPPPKPPKPH